MKEGALGPGQVKVLNGIDKAIKVDCREKVRMLEPQRTITLDHVPLEVIGVIFFQIYAPASSVLNVNNVEKSLCEDCAGSIRSAMASNKLVDFLANKKKIQIEMQVFILHIFIGLYIII